MVDGNAELDPIQIVFNDPTFSEIANNLNSHLLEDGDRDFCVLLTNESF